MSMKSAYQHLYARLTADSTVTTLVSNRIYNRVPEQASYSRIYMGEPVVSEDRGTKQSGVNSQTIEIDLQCVVPDSRAAASTLITLLSAVQTSLHRYSDSTVRSGYSLEMGDATFGPRTTNDIELIGVVSWTCLLRQT